LLAGTAAAKPGYLTTARDDVVRSGAGLCWHTSSWRPALAAEPCEPLAKSRAQMPVAVAPEPAPAPAAAAPKAMPAPAPAPQPKQAAPAPVIRAVTLSTGLLFGFDRAELRPGGEAKLRELADDLRGAQIESLSALGYADRIGDDAYNLDLSERRAEAVRDYLAELGVELKLIKAEGRGESDPVTGEACGDRRGDALIACLQPDRRVELEARGHRAVAAR
jgi:OOP family OmpA-OmpF porin